MAPHSSSSHPNAFRVTTPEDVHRIECQIGPSIEEAGLELHSFKIAWYNALVAPEYKLTYHDDCLAFVVISRPSMFERAFLPFLANVLGPSTLDSNSVYFDPIDKCMQHYFDIFKQKLSIIANSVVECIHDFDLQMPQRRPRILLQTAAHVSGAAYYYKTQCAKQRMGVCIHPSFGGWFGIRGVFLFPHLLTPDLVVNQPVDVVPAEKQTELLHLFNDRWKDMTYRDIIPAHSRYSPLQIEYFSLKPKDRIEFIKLNILPILGQFKDPLDLSHDQTQQVVATIAS